MEQKRDLAIVLRSIAYEERHRVVTALTERHGQITAMARNAIQSRRFGGSLEPFAASEWLFTEKPGAELQRLDEAQIRRPYEGLRKSFDRLSLASVFSELMLKLAPRQEPCPDLFRLHSNALAILEETPEDPRADLAILNAYLAKLLQWSGSQPQAQACLQCQITLESLATDASVTCAIADAGWVCVSCRGQETRHLRDRGSASFQNSFLRVSVRAMRDFELSMSLPLRQLTTCIQATREEHRDLFRFLEALFVYHLPGFDQQPLKGLRFLDLDSNFSGSR